MIYTVVNLVRGTRARAKRMATEDDRPVHPKDKLDFICILMVAWHKTSHDMERDLSVIKLPWWNGEPVPI